MSPPTRALPVPTRFALGALLVVTVAAAAARSEACACPDEGMQPANQPAADQQPAVQQPAQQAPSEEQPAGVQPGSDSAADAGAQDLDAGPTLELSLERAHEIALQRNLGLQIESVNTEVAWYNHRATWGKFDWVVDARAGYTDAEFQPRDVFGGTTETSEDFSFGLTRPIALTGGTFSGQFGSVTTRTNSAFQVEPRSTFDTLTLNYRQPLIRGAWREYATAQQRESELDARRQDEVLRQTRQKLLLDVSVAYWNLVAARELLSVADSSLDLAKAQVDLNQRRLDAGSGTQVEVLQAQAEVARREEARLKAEVDQRKAADDLKQLLEPGTERLWWETVLVPTTPLPEAGDAQTSVRWEIELAFAIDRRPELRQQRLRIEADDVIHERTKSERNAALDLDLTATSQGFSQDFGNAVETTASYDFPTYRAALVFNYALGNHAGRNNERAAWAVLRAARLAYADLESRIVAEVRDGVRQVRYQAEAVRAADKSLELAQRQLAAEQARYANDLSTTFQVLQFQQDLAQAMTSSRTARADYAKALVTLAAAQGLLGDSRAH